ncbi:U-scoloptoxin(19)-Tl1a-like [Anticarsia gemmatalis]|uniref:U-scoloptoxin(19)-Tl1a-like n=1 Tax=Anticarsia gemmatalis TaxID=129554 RepID=UPI003F7702DC
MKWFIIFCAICMVSANMIEDEELETEKGEERARDKALREIDSVFQEPGCSRKGGMCVIGVDCPEGRLANERGLCTAQKKRKVECCYGISIKETRCQKRGGECLPGRTPCTSRLIYPGATDCPNETTCCILVG